MKSSIFRQDQSKCTEELTDESSSRKARLQGPVLAFCGVFRDSSASTSPTNRLPVHPQHISAQDFKICLLVLDVQF